MNHLPTRPGYGTPSEPLWARLAAPAMVTGGLLLLLVYAAAVLSSLLSGHGIPALRGGWIGGAVHLIAHEGNPVLAWANPAAAPPEWLFMLCLVVLLALAILAGLRAWGWWVDRRQPGVLDSRLKDHGFLSTREAAARFGGRAARREAKRLHPTLSAEELKRRPIAELAIPLGRCGSRWVYASIEHAIAVLAGMRQGKTTGVLARIAVSHRGPLVYTTTKPADLRHFYGSPANAPGRTILFNPDDLGGLGSAAFDPVMGCEEPEVARLRAEAILARQRARERDRGLDWALLAEKLLKYLLHAAALDGLDGRPSCMPRVVEWAAAQDFEAAGIARSLLRSSEAPGWAELLREMGRAAPETLYSIKINLHEALACWEDPGLLRRVTPGHGAEVIDPGRLLRRGDRLLILARPGGHSVPLTTALVSAVVEAARQEARRAVISGGRLDPPLLLLLDEVTKVCPLPQMPELVTDCASQGVVPIYALQSLEDGEQAWGAPRFQGMWSATNCLLVMGMVSSDRTLRALSDLSPTVKVEVDRSSRDRYGGRMDPVVRWEPALTADEIRAIPHHTGVAFYGPRPMRLVIPHVESGRSDVRFAATASTAAWHAWVAAHQGAPS